ncbi:hypothetical protein [Pseudanabaena sp. 'Roaring Creek']|uniref:hypothetical protein n=1 Tax=Pseudanabaena sp. 'Roaring Creek' TaxID=1681830 RepID=UPI0006D8176C|nr:hypothetical protein [Pseudanabaena sp. 'Roaring Creek']
MERTDIKSPNHFLTIELSSEIYATLLAKVENTGKTESELVIQGLQHILNEDSEEERFSALEIALEQKLRQYVEKLLEDRISSTATVERSTKDDRHTNLDADRNPQNQQSSMPIPTIRPLQIGDRVLILEPDSPYYMAKLLVTKTSLIRATVETDTGEKTFLKRDLRFVESQSEI